MHYRSNSRDDAYFSYIFVVKLNCSPSVPGDRWSGHCNARIHAGKLQYGERRLLITTDLSNFQRGVRSRLFPLQTKYFVSRELLPDIFGGRFSSLPQSEHPLNIALIVYSTLGATTVRRRILTWILVFSVVCFFREVVCQGDVSQIVRFNDAVGQEQLAEKVERLVFPGAGKSRSSQWVWCVVYEDDVY